MIFFFFQAEDGIRFWSVPGVQTCALPICARELEGVMGGEAEMAPNGDMVFTTPLGRLRVTKASPEQKGEIFRSVSVQVQSIDKARNLLTPSKVDIEADGDEIVLRPDHCGGTLLRFREKGSS